MEHKILFGNSNRENGPTFLDFDDLHKHMLGGKGWTVAMAQI